MYYVHHSVLPIQPQAPLGRIAKVFHVVVLVNFFMPARLGGVQCNKGPYYLVLYLRVITIVIRLVPI